MIQTRPAEAPAVPAKTTRDVLLHAALLIEERGWSDDEPETPDGCLCAGGALSLAAGAPTAWGNRHPIVIAAAEALTASLGESPDDSAMGFVANWNDAPGRTAAEVVAALRAAADSA